jgi:hypothetical protein
MAVGNGASAVNVRAGGWQLGNCSKCESGRVVMGTTFSTIKVVPSNFGLKGTWNLPFETNIVKNITGQRQAPGAGKSRGSNDPDLFCTH